MPFAARVWPGVPAEGGEGSGGGAIVVVGCPAATSGGEEGRRRGHGRGRLGHGMPKLALDIESYPIRVDETTPRWGTRASTAAASWVSSMRCAAVIHSVAGQGVC